MDKAAQHAWWIAQAREHLKEHRPKAFERLTQAGTLDDHLREMADATAHAMEVQMRMGNNWQEAWEVARVNLFPEPEPETMPKMKETEGFRAHRDLMRDLGKVTWPGEKEQPEED